MTRKTRKTSQPGRPRDPNLDARILEAALRELGERGFSAMSIERVAALAGVPKPTLYRRWKGKADLATAAIRRLQAQEPLPTKGSPKARLQAVLANFRRNLLRPNGMAMIGTLLVEEARHPDLLDLFRERIVAPRRLMLAQILESAMERGELDPGADLDAAVNLLIGSFYARYLSGEPIPRSWPRRIVETIWIGIERRSSR